MFCELYYELIFHISTEASVATKSAVTSVASLSTAEAMSFTLAKAFAVVTLLPHLFTLFLHLGI